MNESDFTHLARRRRNATGEPHREVVQLAVGKLQFFRRGAAVGRALWFKRAKIFHDRADRVFAAGFGDLAALKLVRINVADELAQRVEMRAARNRLIILFYR